MRCELCGAEEDEHYDGVQCLIGQDTWSSTRSFTPKPQTDRTIGFDYENQAWVVDGVYVSCGHRESMNCGCFGRIHAGESPAVNAEIH